jgi:PhoD-like phosphatase
MARLVLGPLLRYAGETDATVWVETDAACDVEVLGHRASTFAVGGHHYALVVIRGLGPGSMTAYEVHLDGRRAWPEDDAFPQPVIRTHVEGGAVDIMFGSCRVCAPHEPPWSLPKEEDPRGREIDALRAQSMRMQRHSPEQWPHALVLLGDQVYADEVSPEVAEFIRARRDPTLPPGVTVADFEEYTRLYREAWSEPHVRWLLSTVPSAMIFDDHDVHDDWNTSDAWVETMRAQAWWDERIIGGFVSYWLYQHLGNLSPRELEEDQLWHRVAGCDGRDGGDALAVLREFAFRADREVEGTRWSFYRDIGPARLVMVDSRAGRVLDSGRRAMVDAEEWEWITEHATGGFDHLLIGTSLPLLTAPALHHVEAWDEAVCDGAWGGVAALVGEKLRQDLDLEHWPAFRRSFESMCELLEDVGAGRRGEAPASIVALSGDVHHAYLAEVGFRRGAGVRSRVYQATCSPFRNPLDDRERRAIRALWSRLAARLGQALARSAGVPDPSVRWRLAHDAPWFENQVATLRLEGRSARMRLEKTLTDDAEGDGRGRLRLERVFERQLA